MPSDARIAEALHALRAPIDAFRAAVSAAQAQVADYVDMHRAPAATAAATAAAALGRFADGRVDAARFAGAFGGTRVLGDADARRLERCRGALAALLAAGDAAFIVEVPPGADLEGAVGTAYARLGTAFGAAHAFQSIRAGTYREELYAAALDGRPFEAWNAAERLLAPPLVVSVDGADLEPARLARFLDGRVRIVLLVRGAVAPAALVPLCTPGTLVVQGDDLAAVGLAAAARGPAAVALVPQSAAAFAHDPAGGARLCDRLTVSRLPADAPRAVGQLSAAQDRKSVV